MDDCYDDYRAHIQPNAVTEIRRAELNQCVATRLTALSKITAL
jgi:hypothetical protein